MTCVECDLLQDAICEGHASIVYVRVGNSNVAIIGCQSHVRTLLERYNLGLKALEKTL